MCSAACLPILSATMAILIKSLLKYIKTMNKYKFVFLLSLASTYYTLQHSTSKNICSKMLYSKGNITKSKFKLCMRLHMDMNIHTGTVTCNVAVSAPSFLNTSSRFKPRHDPERYFFIFIH